MVLSMTEPHVYHLNNINRIAPSTIKWGPDQVVYFAHLLSSWYGWKLGRTGFIMPSDYWRSVIEARIRKAVKTTERNCP
jgi:hypothetical protein